jgi:hypothetical protein
MEQPVLKKKKKPKKKVEYTPCFTLKGERILTTKPKLTIKDFLIREEEDGGKIGKGDDESTLQSYATAAGAISAS